MIDGVVIRNAEIDRAINKAYRELVKRGELLKESALSCGIDDQERYDLTSSSIWLQDSGLSKLTGRVANNYTSSDTTIAVDDATGISAGMLLRISTSSTAPDEEDEVVYVSAVDGTDLTVIRGVANTTADSIAAGEYLWYGTKPAILKLLRVDWNEYQIDPISMQDISNVDVT